MPSSKTRIAAAKRPPAEPIRVVAIGASAGGLEAFSALLRALPADIPMAFMLIQHLDPKRQSLLPELLARTTHISVHEVTQGTTVEANHVYVMPSDCDIVLKDGHFTLLPRTTKHEIHAPIDIFMRSLAEKAGNRAIGVVLSGTGSDGTAGVEAIRAAGGVTFAQDPKTAKFDGMPKSAIEAGCIDMVLPPGEIARELGRMSQQTTLEQTGPRQARRRDGNRSDGPDTPEFVPPSHGSEEGLGSILSLLRASRGCDFSEYKPNTLHRRTQQRMAFLRLHSAGEYRKYLEKHPEEIDKLCAHILIPVTQFFRDPEVFAALKKTVFPAITGEKSINGHIRVWAPACSTGEEAYSLAISLLEFLGPKSDGFRIQIFGSDVNANGIAKARAGVYPSSITENVSEERLQRFFTKVENGYRVGAAVRESCVFARQDVTNDPPFSNLDLISCRNLLIYIEPELQQRIISIFHYSLKPKGFLLLGHSESADSHPQLFTPVDKKSKIYAKRIAAHRLQHDFWRSGEMREQPERGISGTGVPSRRQDSQGEVHLQQVVDRMVLSKYASPGVVVNDSLEILQFRGRTSPYLDPASGRASFNLLKMVREDLAVALRGAIAAAKKKGAPVRKKDVAFERNGQRRTVNLSVVPIDEPSASSERFYLILFDDGTVRAAPAPEGRKGSKSGKDANRLVAGLKRDLTAARTMLRDNIAAQDALREDYQSANEELLSANEELQSTNEELETSKEELQSANEELTTVNDELSSSNFELNLLSNDLTNLLDSTIIPVVMVDRGLCIRRMTPAAEKLFKVLPQDVGRRITDMGPDIDIDLKPLLLQVIQDVVSIDREVRDHEGCWYRVQIKPYKTLDGKISGAILAVIDIDAIKKVNQQLKIAGEFTTSIIETMPEPVLVLTVDLRVRAANGAFYNLFQLGPETTLNEFVYKLGDSWWDISELRILLEKILPEQKEFSTYEIVHEFPGIGTKLLVVNGRYMAQGPDDDPLILLSFGDLTQRKKAEAALIQAEKLSIAGRLAASIAHEVNNPLEAVTNLIYLASDGNDLDAARSYMKQALEQLGRVSHITQQTLRFHRQSSGPSSVKLHELVDSVIDLFQGKLTAHNISVERQFNGEPSATLLAGDIRQVLANILGNAIDAMPSGGVLTVRVRQSNDWRERTRRGVRVTIGDSGSGMTQQVRRRMYEPFFTTNKKEGTGLGMWVASQLIERHQGDLHVWSTLRRGSSGTVFSLFLPLELSEQRLEALSAKPLSEVPIS